MLTKNDLQQIGGLIAQQMAGFRDEMAQQVGGLRGEMQLQAAEFWNQMGIVMEDAQHKFDLLVEGQQALGEQMTRMASICAKRSAQSICA